MRPGMIRALAIATTLALLGALGTIGVAGCYSLTAQDQTALGTSAKLTASAYCHLDGGGAPRALIRAAHAEEVGILRRNGVDAGDSTIDCP